MPQYTTPTPAFLPADYEMPRVGDNDTDKVSRQKNIDAINANFIAQALDRVELAAQWSASYTYDGDGKITKAIFRYANTKLAARSEYAYESGSIGDWPVTRLKTETRSYSTDYDGDEVTATWSATGIGTYLYNAIGNVSNLNWS